MSTSNPSGRPPPIDAIDLEALISRERFAAYVGVTGDAQRAVALYRWNARVSGAFAELLQHVEVMVRNAMHHLLMDHHATVADRPTGAAWFDGPSWVRHHWFSRQAIESISKSIRFSGHSPSNPRPGKVISELGFGFWRYLASERYEQSFWSPAIDHAFAAPGATVRERRRAVEDRLAPLHILRNRIAHCEPIFGTITYQRRRVAPALKHLDDLHLDAIDLVSWISPSAATWLAGDVDQVAGLLAARP